MRQDKSQLRALGSAALQLREIKRQMIADSLKRKLTVRDLRAKYDLSASTVRALLQDKGAESVRLAAAGLAAPRRRYNTIDRSPPERFFADARTKRFTRSELAAKYGVSYEKAANYLRDANIEIPRKLHSLNSRVASAMGRRLLHMLALRKQDKTLKEIGTSTESPANACVRSSTTRMSSGRGTVFPVAHLHEHFSDSP